MSVRKKGVAILFILVITAISCGFTFKKKVVTLDTESYVLYKNCSVGQISAELEKDQDSAKEMYDDGYYAIMGKIKEIAKNNKFLVIEDEKGTGEMTIKCIVAEKSVIAEMSDLKLEESVVVYGKMKVSAFQGNVSVDMVHIIRENGQTGLETQYSSLDGKNYDIANMYTRTLADKKVKYYIPQKWAEVEINNLKNNQKSMEGYQYILNGIQEETATEAENFFVCYFDSKEKLADRGQKNDKEGIRKAIVDNILGTNIKRSDIKKIDTYYGTKYFYYVGKYDDKQEQSHRIEFVFQEVEEDGMVVYLYVYEKEKHLDDILAVMRFLEAG